jgi:hypothetical protein
MTPASTTMHGTMNLKFANAKQAEETYEYKNIKQKTAQDNSSHLV